MKQRRNRRTFQERTGCDVRLLTPGFGGELSPKELETLQKELERRSKLRKQWGFEEQEQITKKKLQEIALGESKDDE